MLIINNNNEKILQNPYCVLKFKQENTPQDKVWQ